MLKIQRKKGNMNTRVKNEKNKSPQLLYLILKYLIQAKLQRYKSTDKAIRELLINYIRFID